MGSMYNVSIRDIKRQAGLTKKVEYNEPCDIAEVDLLGPVNVVLKLTNATSRITIDGHIETHVSLTCSRCLESYRHHLQFDFFEEFLPEGSPELGNGKDLEWEDLSRFTYTGDSIDVYELIRQNILAEVPMKPLCREDCKGLCTVCGENLNSESCSCSVDSE
ncbi:MAG: DUF177 domain-containing protein [Candidatus Eremiobacteraeota bacterium]|nr:DUF177 domain-containing protein [Candidatus Eremiobacteraeota bacterium]